MKKVCTSHSNHGKEEKEEHVREIQVISIFEQEGSKLLQKVQLQNFTD